MTTAITWLVPWRSNRFSLNRLRELMVSAQQIGCLAALRQAAQPQVEDLQSPPSGTEHRFRDGCPSTGLVRQDGQSGGWAGDSGSGLASRRCCCSGDSACTAQGWRCRCALKFVDLEASGFALSIDDAVFGWQHTKTCLQSGPRLLVCREPCFKALAKRQPTTTPASGSVSAAAAADLTNRVVIHCGTPARTGLGLWSSVVSENLVISIKYSLTAARQAKGNNRSVGTAVYTNLHFEGRCGFCRGDDQGGAFGDDAGDPCHSLSSNLAHASLIT